jgi:hypothetical protein
VQERSLELLFKHVNDTCIYFWMYQDSVTLPIWICLAKTMHAKALQKMEYWSEPALQRPQGISKVGISIRICFAKTIRHFKKWTVCSKGHLVSRNAPPLFSFVSHDTWQISWVSTRYRKRKWFFFADTLCTVTPFGVGGGEGCLSISGPWL